MTEFPAIIAALPREVKALVRGWEARLVSRHVWVYTNGSAVVACAGMGADRAALAVRAALAAGPVTALISAGVAGACDPKLRVGDVVRAGLVVDSRTGESFCCGLSGHSSDAVLVTTPEIASVQEKARLSASYRASAVDMEAATVGRLARAHGVRFEAIKAISDEAGFELEELGRFATADGQFREAAFGVYAAVRPRLWGKLIALARNSGVALGALTGVLESELKGYRERG